MKSIYYFIFGVLYFPVLMFERHVLKRKSGATGAGVIGEGLYMIFGYVTWAIIAVILFITWIIF